MLFVCILFFLKVRADNDCDDKAAKHCEQGYSMVFLAILTPGEFFNFYALTIHGGREFICVRTAPVITHRVRVARVARLFSYHFSTAHYCK